MKLLVKGAVAAFALAVLAACGEGVPLPRAPAPPQAAVAAPDAFSAQVASDVLAKGGNAVDAAVAAAFALAVTYPEAGNLGGGGFMLAWVDGRGSFIDYRETAPAAADRDMYLDSRGEVVEGRSLTGALAAGVPGTVAGMWQAQQRLGRLEWKDLLAPAIDLAEHGFLVPEKLESAAREEMPRIGESTNFAKYFGGLRAGTVFRQPELAATLKRIRDGGASGFYAGETADLVAGQMQRLGGLITLADLTGYQVVWREPLLAPWRGYSVLSAPPPSSGGIAIVQLLKMKDRLARDFKDLPHNSPQYVHLTAEMEKRVFADRAEYLGDPAFVDVPVANLLADDYIARRSAAVDREKISGVDAVPPGLEHHDTLHLSIVDRWGNAAANTYTLNTEFGSGVVVEGAGFLLNNEMDDFSVKPGTPNVYGVVGSTANEVQPGKRMLSSMSPTMLLEDGRVKMVLGSPGGSTIITTVYQTIVNVLDFGMPATDAVAAARFHHQLLPPDLVTFSPYRPLPATTIDALSKRGYRVEPHPWEIGDVQLVLRDGESWQAASDPRGRGESRVMQ
ncbi:MAG TPA: gamma-glutamyltransferase [Steroidobacteraceae bacterium]|nr:gamma-glutamyltransferase [Steroidobacteraceae bacterium]